MFQTGGCIDDSLYRTFHALLMISRDNTLLPDSEQLHDKNMILFWHE